MTKPTARDSIYRKRAFDADIIELCVRWYITYRLSYRDLVEMMADVDVRKSCPTFHFPDRPMQFPRMRVSY
jgi:transposase-like protein